MKELKMLLANVSDSYYDFVEGVVLYAKKSNQHTLLVTNYIKQNPDATSSDIIEFISDQPDFMDDVVLNNVI